MGDTPKCYFVLKLRLPTFWKPITSCANLWWKWSLKQSFKSCQEFSNNMLHATWTHVIQGDFWLLMVRNQIGALSVDLSFGHNLYYKYSNGSCKPIFNIYVSRTFQDIRKFSIQWVWPLKLLSKNSIGNPFRSVWAHSLTLFCTFGLHFQLAPFHAFSLVMSPRLWSWH